MSMSPDRLQIREWILFGACLLMDIVVGFVFMLGMDMHIGALGPITLSSLPALAVLSLFGMFQAILVVRLFRSQNRRHS